MVAATNSVEVGHLRLGLQGILLADIAALCGFELQVDVQEQRFDAILVP